MSQTQIVGIGQIAVRVLDLDRAIATYRDRMGLRFLFRAPPALAFFQCGGVRLMLSPPEAGEFDHASSILYFTVDDIQSTHDQLTGRGVRFRSAPHVVADLGDRVLWLSDFEDGEGNVHALMAEVPKEGRAREPAGGEASLPDALEEEGGGRRRLGADVEGGPDRRQ